MSSEAEFWQTAPAGLTFPLGRMDTWKVCLDSLESSGEWLSVLSPDEITRAERFHFQRDQKRFVRCRAALRDILGRYLNLPPAGIRFRYQSNGKPEIAEDQNPNDFRFNVSHSSELAIIAVTAARSVGVDIEKVRSDIEYLDLARRFFSPREYQGLLSLPPSERPRAFFACWTRKEAFLKATGSGLGFPLSEFSVSVAPDAPAEIQNVQADPRAVLRWSLADLQPEDGYVGTLAFEGGPCRTERWLWSVTDLRS